MSVDRGLCRSHLDEANLIDHDSLLIRPLAREEKNRRLPADLLTGETIPLLCQVSMDSHRVMVDVYDRESGQRHSSIGMILSLLEDIDRLLLVRIQSNG